MKMWKLRTAKLLELWLTDWSDERKCEVTTSDLLPRTGEVQSSLGSAETWWWYYWNWPTKYSGSKCKVYKGEKNWVWWPWSHKKKASVSFILFCFVLNSWCLVWKTFYVCTWLPSCNYNCRLIPFFINFRKFKTTNNLLYPCILRSCGCTI